MSTTLDTSHETQVSAPAGTRQWLRHQAETFTALLLRPVDAASLAVFRVLFGAIMVWEVYRYFAFDRVTRYYVIPEFYFTYELFPFVKPWPEPWMHIHFMAMAIFALGMGLGLFYRLSTYLFLLTYSYVFLLDKAQYNNHYYLIILVAFLLLCTDAHRWASLDAWRKGWLNRAEAQIVPFWQVFILRAQIVIVYFFGGVAKLNADWLAAEPIGAWLRNRAHYPVLGPFFATEAGAYFFAYGGLFFDLFIGLFLLWPRTRWLALIGVLFFNLMNKWLFSIGVFPYLMIAMTVIFFNPDGPRRLLGRLPISIPASWPDARQPRQVAVVSFVVIYLAIQILMPLRHWLYPGYVSWTEQGHRFSWHMKLRDKEAFVIFYITDPKTNQTWEVDFDDRLTVRQYAKMATRPDMVVQFARHIKEEFHRAGVIENPIITVDAWASLNGRPFQQFIDPTVDLGRVDSSLFTVYDWVAPFRSDVPIGPGPEEMNEDQEPEDFGE